MRVFLKKLCGIIGNMLRPRLCFASITAWVLGTREVKAIIHNQTAIKSWIPLHLVFKENFGKMNAPKIECCDLMQLLMSKSG